jgi:hypothetical protein
MGVYVAVELLYNKGLPRAEFSTSWLIVLTQVVEIPKSCQCLTGIETARANFSITGVFTTLPFSVNGKTRSETSLPTEQLACQYDDNADLKNYIPLDLISQVKITRGATGDSPR